MRVIHICAYYAPAYVYGGPVRSIHALCMAQQAAGMSVQVFTTTANGRTRLEPAPDGREVDKIRVRYFELSPPARLLGARDLAPALARAVDEVGVVHIHGLFNRTVWDAAAVLHAANKPYVLSPRGMLEPPALAHHRWRKRLTWHLRDRAVVARARVLHATSTFEAATLAREHGPSRVVQIPNAVAVEEPRLQDVSALRQSLGIPADAPVVLSLGRLHAIKRLDLVAAAFLELRQRAPSAHLVFAGPDEQQLRPALSRQLAEADHHVHWIESVNDDAKRALLAAATVLVQCSDSESFGMSVAEALAAGTPVVVTRTCPWQEIEEWGCGSWVEQSAPAISAALYTIVADQELRRAQGHAARRLIEARMAPPRVANAWHQVYVDAARARSVAA